MTRRDTNNSTKAGTSGEAPSLSAVPPGSGEPTAETSARLLLAENKATGAQPPCLCKDGNVFQITDGRMEILVARLDFLLAGCRESGRFSNSPLWEPTPLRSPETSRGETAVRRPSSNTRMRNFVKPCPRRLGRLHKRDGPPSSRRSPRPVIEIDASVPRCWPTPATRQMSRKPTGGHYLTLHRQIFLLRWLTTVQEGGKTL